MRHYKMAAFAAMAGLVALGSGCADDSSSRRTTVTHSPPTVTSDGRIVNDSRTAMRDPGIRDPGMRRTLTDANILAILEATSFHTIEESKLAQQRATNPDVRLLASRLTQDHQALQEQSSNVASRLNVTPALPAGERALSIKNQDSMDALKQKSGDAFDEAYLEHRIQMHEKVLDRLDEASMNVQSADVRTLLAQARAGIQANLKTARELQRDVTGGMPSTRGRLP
ncbi:MAG: DUF4142 domain-containing protein [Nitrospiraceae bacterium]